MNQLGLTMAGIPTLAGNELHLLAGAEPALQSLLQDVELARRSLHLQFYIWRAADSSTRWSTRWRGPHAAGRLPDPGRRARQRRLARRCPAAAAAPRRRRDRCRMPTGPCALFRRNDLRNHRKIAVFDGEIAYTGSLNMTDPRCAPRTSVGPWIDAMVACAVPRSRRCAACCCRTGSSRPGARSTTCSATATAATSPPPAGERAGAAQRPGRHQRPILQMLLRCSTRPAPRGADHAVLRADEAMLRALRSAAARGVDVTLVVPERADSLLVRHAAVRTTTT